MGFRFQILLYGSNGLRKNLKPLVTNILGEDMIILVSWTKKLVAFSLYIKIPARTQSKVPGFAFFPMCRQSLESEKNIKFQENIFCDVDIQHYVVFLVVFHVDRNSSTLLRLFSHFLQVRVSLCIKFHVKFFFRYVEIGPATEQFKLGPVGDTYV